MFGGKNYLFQVDIIIIKGSQRFGPGHRDLFFHLAVIFNQSDTAAAATCRCLQHDRITISGGKCQGLVNPFITLYQVGCTRRHGYLGSGHYIPGNNLVA